eukprot:229365_1
MGTSVWRPTQPRGIDHCRCARHGSRITECEWRKVQWAINAAIIGMQVPFGVTIYCHFSEIVDAFDPINIGVECTRNDRNANVRANHQPQSVSSSVGTAHSRLRSNSKTKSNVASLTRKKPRERDLTATNELSRKKERLRKVQEIMQRKANRNVFTTPMGGDHKG